MAYGLPGTWEAAGILDVAVNGGPVGLPPTIGGPVGVNVAGAGALQVVVAVADPPALSDARAAFTSPLKSPARSAAVGTHVVTKLPRRSRFHSSFHQKKSLFF